LLVESLLLSLGGIATGTVLAALGSQRLQDWMRVLDVPAEAQLRLDVPVLVFAFAAGLLATLAFGLYPALHGARRHSLTGVADSGRSTAGRRHGRVRGTLVVAQVGLALLLVLGASLLIRSFLHRLDFDLGFDHRRVFATRFEYRPGLSRTPANLQRFYREVLDRVARVPGVQGAAMSSSLPGFFARQSSPLGVSRAMSGEPPLAVLTFCSEGILDALGFRLVAGRSLTRSDVDASRKVVLVNETFAHRYFDTENPLGQWIRVDRLATQRPAVPDPIFQIVGVVEDIANSGITDPPGPEVYLPYSIPGVGAQWLFVRSTTAPERLLALVREQVHSVDPTVALEEPGPFQSQHPGWPVTDEHRFSLLVLAAFAITGLGLVALGVYGVIAYTVSQQTREFAIRLALGGERRQVGAQVLRTTFWLVGAGTLIGLGASFATGRVLATQLYQTSPRDPITLAAAVAVILLTGAVACIVPARRAMRVEPAVALRHDE
jgi:predicted permease